MPAHMNVTNGLRPDNLDKDVRFRTTYYFRAFDYCWKADGPLGSSPSYRRIIPETDVVYRFRMTGKASGLGSKIHFESGTLDKDAIEPFGKLIRFDDAIESFRSTTPEALIQEGADARAAKAAAAAEAERAAHRALALALMPAIVKLVDMPNKPAELTTAVNTLRELVAAGAPPETVAKAEEKVEKAAETIDSPAIKAAFVAVKTTYDDLEKRVKTLESTGPDKVLPGCSNLDFIRRGFEIMGPEGVRPFNQNERLILAMHSSAEPLIDTLQEYSSHLLAGQPSKADRLLPLAQASVRLGDARRAAESPATGGAGGVEGIFLATLQALGAKEPGK